jgi:CheY-like chemotaxis protein
VRVGVRSDDGVAVIEVKDDGVGIAADELGGIFDPFVQLDASLERAQSGLGLGLALVKQLAEMHGGSVVAESGGAGKGATFTVRLPIAAAHPDKRNGATPAHVAPRRILVVDDNHDSAESLAALLQLDGHETRIAHDGAEAVDAAMQMRPDAILLDIGLPILNGYDACRRIRDARLATDPLIIALTGWSQDSDRQRSSDAGFDAHLVKPVDFAALAALLASPRQA